MLVSKDILNEPHIRCWLTSGLGETGESRLEPLHTLDRSSRPQANSANLELSNLLAGLWLWLKVNILMIPILQTNKILYILQ